MASEDEEGVSATLNVNFESTSEATIAKNTLQVDPEPSRSSTVKKFSVSQNKLIISVKCPDVRELRIAMNSLMDHLHLVNQTIKRFGPALPVTKKRCLEINDTNTIEG